MANPTPPFYTGLVHHFPLMPHDEFATTRDEIVCGLPDLSVYPPVTDKHRVQRLLDHLRQNDQPDYYPCVTPSPYE